MVVSPPWLSDFPRKQRPEIVLPNARCLKGGYDVQLYEVVLDRQRLELSESRFMTDLV